MKEALEPNLDEVQDFRFAAIESELYVIREWSEAVERQLPLTIKSETARLEAELSGADEYDRHEIEQWILQFTEEVLPRFFRGPILVALWAIFESAIREIAEDLGRQGGHELVIEDLRGGDVLERAKKYYKLVLHFPLMTASSNEEPIRMLLSVRNAIAHANGRLEMIKPSECRKIDEWEKSRTGLSTDYGHLSYSAVFVKDMIQTVTSFLEDLIGRVKEHNQIETIGPI